MDPLPYNVTISSQTASIMYAPIRDGPLTSGWNVSYSGGVFNTGYGVPQGVGADSHRTTLAGSTMTMSWVGSAVYLYGQATSASYSIVVDGASTTVQTADVPQGGLLGSKTGLAYGNHTVVLTALGGTVAFQYAEISIGIGYQNSTSRPVNSTVFAVNENGPAPSPNSFFRYQSTGTSNSWKIESTHNVLYANGSFLPFPEQMLTEVAGESVSFILTNTSAFFLWGAVNSDHGVKTVDISRLNNSSQNISTSINDTSSVLDFKQILYWASGLDRDESYLVRVTDEAAAFSFSSLDTIDGGPITGSGGSSQSPGVTSTASRSNETAAPGRVMSGKSRLSTGAIAGIAIAAAAVLLLVIGLFFWRRRRRSAALRVPSVQPFIYSANNGRADVDSGNDTSATHSSGSVPLMMVEADAGRVDIPALPVPPPGYQIEWADAEVNGNRDVRANLLPPLLGVGERRTNGDRKDRSRFR